MHIDSSTAFILEGGGMRGVFTAGVLDALMAHDIHFGRIVAVSAGACNGLSYASWQPERARKTNIDMLEKYHYIGLGSLIRNGSIFDPVLLYDRFPNELLPFDYDRVFSSGILFEMVATNCLTGRSEYLHEDSGDRQRLMNICRASSSLPYVSRMVEVDGKPFLDGGIIDSIPFDYAFGTGARRCVVVATRNRGWRDPGHDVRQPRFVYSRFPRLRVALSHRIEAYRRQLDRLEALEDEGRVVVVRPQKPITVGRMERDTTRLCALYDEGVGEGHRFARWLENRESSGGDDKK